MSEETKGPVDDEVKVDEVKVDELEEEDLEDASGGDNTCNFICPHQ